MNESRCGVLAAVEFPELEHPSHQVALQFKQIVHARFREIGAQAGAQQPDLLADQILLLMNGTLMQGRVRGSTYTAHAVVQAARVLVGVLTVGREEQDGRSFFERSG